MERQLDVERRLKAQGHAWKERLQDIKKDVVAHTKARDREAKELQKAEVCTYVCFVCGCTNTYCVLRECRQACMWECAHPGE